MVNLYHCSLSILLCHAATSTAGIVRKASDDSAPYLDASLSPSQRADDLLSRMTWDEKVGQMGGIRRILGTNSTFNRTSYDTIRPLQNGIIGFGSMLNSPLTATPLMNQVRAEQINSTRLGIPYITVTDSVNGPYLEGGTLFPASLSMGSTWNVPLYEQVVTAIRDENRALGTYWVLSPELDLAKEPRGGRVGEMYGEDAYLVGSFGSQYVKTMQEKNEQGHVRVATTVKHFVFGQNSGGVNTASMNEGINEIMNDLAAPFHRVIQEAQPLSLMASYASVDRVPMHDNEYMLQTILRDSLGFQGLIMSDALGILNLYNLHAVATSIQDAAVHALQAGVGLELSPSQPACFPSLVTTGNNSQIVSLVNDAVHHILEIKFATGVFEEPLASVDTVNSTLRAQAHLDTNRNASREAIVLLQNDGLLPLTSSSRKVAVLGPFAARINAGSYAANNSTDTAFGNRLTQSLEAEFGAANVQYVEGVHIIDTTDDSGIADAVQAAKDAGLAVLMLGSLSTSLEDPSWPKRTDGEFFAHADLGFPGLQQQLLDAVLDTGVPLVLVLSGGQAFALSNSTLRANAILHSFLGGEYTSDAIVEIITGKVNPSGKLTVSLPEVSGQTTVYYDYLPSDNAGGPSGTYPKSAWQFPILQRNVSMPFGFGLSYTTFDVSAPTVNARNGSVQVSVTARNTGAIAGKEVVQVYFRQQYSAIERPVKKLIRFEKVELQAGESQDVAFSIPVSELGYWINTKRRVDSGNYTFWAGSSSRDQDLKNVTVAIAV